MRYNKRRHYEFKKAEIDFELRNEEKMIAKAKAIAKANAENAKLNGN